MQDRFKLKVFDKHDNKLQTVINIDYERNVIEWYNSNDEKRASYIEERKVVQCVGLKDKNGKLIYEGDIIQGNTIPFTNEEWGITEPYSATYKGKVIFENFTFLADVIDLTRHTLNLKNFETIEVIGNIYENPELLEG